MLAQAAKKDPLVGLTPEQEEDAYFQDEKPGQITMSLDSFESDKICRKCSLWKSEHEWDLCTDPDWI